MLGTVEEPILEETIYIMLLVKQYIQKLLFLFGWCIQKETELFFKESVFFINKVLVILENKSYRLYTYNFLTSSFYQRF